MPGYARQNLICEEEGINCNKKTTNIQYVTGLFMQLRRIKNRSKMMDLSRD